MNKRTILFAAMAPALLLGGCGGTRNLGVESVHQPVVSRSDYAFDLATAGGGLAIGERERLAGWMRSLRLGYGDRVSIDDPAGRTLAREQVAAQVARHGLLLSDDAPVTAAPIAPGTIRVVIARMTAAVPGCPDWSRDSSNDIEQHTSSNYGCASNASLAAMVARPEDLVRGQPGADTPDTAVASKAIDTFRKTAPSGAGGLRAETAGGK